jgi:hypothetical protein
MKDTISLLIATGILAAGGLGLYMYKSTDDNQEGGGYNEDTLFGSNSFWGSNNDGEDLEDEELVEHHEPKVRARGGKTKRSKKNVGTKRRY